MIPILAEGYHFKAARNDACYLSVQAFLLFMFVKFCDECCATMTCESARFDNITENFFGEKISGQGVIHVVLAPEAHGVPGIHAPLADQVTPVTEPDWSSGRHKEARFTPEILNQMSVRNCFPPFNLS